MLEQWHTNHSNHCMEESLAYERLQKLISLAQQSEYEEKCFLPVNELNRAIHQGRKRYLSSGIMLAQEQGSIFTNELKQESRNLSVQSKSFYMFLQQKQDQEKQTNWTRQVALLMGRFLGALGNCVCLTKRHTEPDDFF